MMARWWLPTLIRILRDGGGSGPTRTIGVSRSMPTLCSLDNLELVQRYPINGVEHFVPPGFCASLIEMSV